MAIFPVSPTVGQEETVLGRTFVYDGYGWVVKVSGGHVFEDSTGNVLTARSVAKAGAGIEFEDDAVGEKTVVKVSENTMESIRTKTYSIDFGSNSYTASEINMLGDIIITNVNASNVDSILLSYSGGIQQPVSLGAVNIAVPASDVLIWEITRQAADMPAVLGVKFEII